MDLSGGGNPWLGAGLLLAGVLLYWTGVKGPFLGAVLFSFLLSAAGALALAGGWGALRPMRFPLGFLVFMIPVPRMFFDQVSLPLQMGVASAASRILGAAGMSVFLEGNLIHTPNAVLAVVNECSGLTYLTALLALAVLLARLTQRAWQARLLLVLFSLPAALVANVARVTVGGWVAQAFGRGAGMSVLENVYGIAVFLFAGALLLGISGIMDWVRGLKAPAVPPEGFEEADFMAEAASSGGRADPPRPVFPRWIVSTMAVAAVGVFLGAYGSPPPRGVAGSVSESEVRFPPQSRNGWLGEDRHLALDLYQAAGADRFVLRRYQNRKPVPVWLYVGYYLRTANPNLVPHSVSVCYPANGWTVLWERVRPVPLGPAGEPWMVNELAVRRFGDRRLVSYWFVLDDRVKLNPYFVWSMRLKSVFTSRAFNSALVRISTPVEAGGLEAARKRINRFIRDFRQDLRAVRS